MTQTEYTERAFLLAFQRDPRSDILSKIEVIEEETCIPIKVTVEPLSYLCQTPSQKSFLVISNRIYPMLSWFHGNLMIQLPTTQGVSTDSQSPK